MYNVYYETYCYIYKNYVLKLRQGEDSKKKSIVT